MKIAIIGPSHPYKGGITQQTTELATRLVAAGHEVSLIAWKSQFPKLLYPGSLLPEGQPEMAVFAATRRMLSWYNPLSWRAAGRYASTCDLVIFVWWVPTIQAPIYNLIRHYIKRSRIAVICHNVLPHESRPGDRQLAQSFLSKANHVIVHSGEQAALAQTLTKSPVSVADLPTILPGWSAEKAQHRPGARHHLLFFGIVRPYKGLDVLLEALALTPDISLTVAGECWGGSAQYEALITKLGLGGRVRLQAGYIAAEQIPELFQSADAVVLPYRSATGTTNVQVAFAYGLPVIVSDIPVLSEQITEGVSGLLFRNGDAADLSRAIHTLYQPENFKRLHASLPAVAVDEAWAHYLNVVMQ